MKDPLLEEFKVWLESNGYGFVTSPMNTRHSVMFDAYKAGISKVTSVRENLLDKAIPNIDDILDKDTKDNRRRAKALARRILSKAKLQKKKNWQ